jgi:hypothetical protein
LGVEPGFIEGLAKAVIEALPRDGASPACAWRCGDELTKCPRKHGVAA